MLETSLLCYAALFGAMKDGAITVPLFALFETDGVGLRVADCRPRLLLAGENQLGAAKGVDGTDVMVAGGDLLAELCCRQSTEPPRRQQTWHCFNTHQARPANFRQR